ncbi:MAG: DUF4215 domain-containing protein [Myxococcales bacterium]|nr:DUF4215 domain-containing protein [Myxococcales bacterium]
MGWRSLLSAACIVALGIGCADDSPGDGGLPDGGDTTMDGGGGTDGGMATSDAGDGCGDGTVDRMSETCDDGNTVDGDGCSADCQSDETCGNGITDAAAGELCDDGNTEDGDNCRSDCLSDYACGNGVVDDIASGGSTDEVCDDGNMLNGDGCSADCLSDESCGNGVVDLAAGEVCDDGNTVDGDDCSADCSVSLLCGNGTLDGVEECDDGNTTDGDGCSGTCLVEGCGNGRLDAGEDCDDGDSDDTNGCTTACSFTCSADSDCADAEPCNGDETCSDPGTGSSACNAGMMLADGTDCGGGNVCSGGSCAAVGCGDGTVSGSEQCDDGNSTNGDGCENDCTFTCSSDADCDDGNTCNGDETCSGAGTTSSACNMGTPPAVGSVCDRGRTPPTRDVCSARMTCVRSRCGDGILDTGATPPEECDDGNTTSGDGCSSTCQMEMSVPPTAFRVVTARLISPRIVAQIPLGGCQDITDNCVRVFGSCANDGVNTLLQTAIDPMSAGGDYSLHIVELFRPLNTAAATMPTEVHLNPVCAEGATDSCGPDTTMPDIVMGTAMNMATGACYMPDPNEVNDPGGTAYSPTANTVGGPCYTAALPTLTITISGIAIPLSDATVSATYAGGSPPNRLVSGIVTGFLSEADARAVTLPTTLPVIGGDPLYQHLQAGGATGSGCNVGGRRAEDDRDMNGGTNGFRFFLNFTGEMVTWTGT